jgi:catechol 2,3-dioxygenase-like lactoylglutathione lyase family enzyme
MGLSIAAARSIPLERLDHLVLTVADIARTCEFYTRVLGMEVVRFGEGRTALRFGQQKINLHSASIPGLHRGPLAYIIEFRDVAVHNGAASDTAASGP